MSNWRLSNAGYFADFVAVPIYILIALAISFTQAEPNTEWFLYFVGGWALFTFGEYWMHRILFHKVFRAEHAIHHMRPTELIGPSSWGTLIIAFVGWVLAVYCAQGVGRGGILFAGFMTGYCAYLTLHTLLHHTTFRLRGFREAHDMHHKLGSKNYGVQTMVWDRVFRTYAASL